MAKKTIDIKQPSKSDYAIKLNQANMGTRLSLVCNKKNVPYDAWEVEDPFNGKAVVEGIDEDIYGMYKESSMVKLYLYLNNNEEAVINNVQINKAIYI